jgi:hypothetical protein
LSPRGQGAWGSFQSPPNIYSTKRTP